MRFALGLALVGWMSLPASSQIFGDDIGHTIPWPTTTLWTGGTVTTMVSGDFTGDLYRDLVLLDGTSLVMAFGPGYFTARSYLESSGIVGVSVVPAAAEGYDALFATTGTGWKKIWIDYPQNPQAQSVQTSSTTNDTWANAFALQTLPGSPPTIVGLKSDVAGTSILYLPDPYGTPGTTTQSDLLDDTGVALALVNWDGTVGSRGSRAPRDGCGYLQPGEPSDTD